MITEKEQAEVLKHILSNAPSPSTLYTSREAGVYAYVKSLNESENTPIRDFYKPSKVKQAVESVDVSKYDKQLKNNNHAEVKQDGNNVKINLNMSKAEYISNEDIKAKLLKHLKAVKEFFDSLATPNGFLTKTVYHTTPAQNEPDFKAMASCFAPRNDVFKGATETEVSPTAWVVKKDKVKTLYELIKKYPQATSHRINVMYEADTPATITLKGLNGEDDIPIKATISENRLDRFGRLADLAEKCGIKPEGMTYYKMTTDGAKERNITDAHFITERILTEALAYMLKVAKDQEVKNRSVVNVRNPEGHTVVGNPTVLNFVDMLVKNAQEQIDTLLKPYRTLEELKADNGIDMYLDDRETLPIFDLATDPKTRMRAIKYYVALQARSLVAFDEWKKDHPDEKTVVISDLAKYTSWGNEVKSGKGLKPEHRNALVKGLEIAGHLSHKYIVGKSRYKGKDGKWHESLDRKYIYLLTRLKSDRIDARTGRTISVEVDFDPEYVKAMKYNLGVVLDNLSKVKTETAIVIGLHLCQRMVAKQNAVVEQGKPIRTTVKKLIEVGGIFDANTTQRCNTVKRSLEELEQAGVIGKWATAKGGKNITAYDKETMSLDVWAKDPTVYITKTQSKRLKASNEVYQKEWHNALKYLHNPNKCYTDPNKLAQDLGITKEQVDIYLGGEDIPQDVGERIVALKSEWTEGAGR